MLSAEPCLWNDQSLFEIPAGAGVSRLACSAVGRAIGARRGVMSECPGSVSAGEQRMPRLLTKSVSDPHSMFVRVLLGVAVVGGRSKLLAATLLPKRKRRFFSPRSRTKEPSTIALETAAAARISREASSERNC